MTTRQAAYERRQKAADPDAWRERMRVKKARERLAHPEKKSAWDAVYRALRTGRLVRPDACERCDIECRPEASHDDYSRQLEVEWLCHRCHTDKDTAARRILRGA